MPGDGWFTSHAHPECYAQTVEDRWDEGDLESTSPGDMDRPPKAGWAAAEGSADALTTAEEKHNAESGDRL
jgi:hypothetical protein